MQRACCHVQRGRGRQLTLTLARSPRILDALYNRPPYTSVQYISDIYYTTYSVPSHFETPVSYNANDDIWTNSHSKLSTLIAAELSRRVDAN